MSDDTICSGESVMFSLLPGAFRYYWNYGDGQSEYGSNVINHVFMNATTAPVTYNVKLTTESFFGCLSETTYAGGCLPDTGTGLHPDTGFADLPECDCQLRK